LLLLMANGCWLLMPSPPMAPLMNQPGLDHWANSPPPPQFRVEEVPPKLVPLLNCEPPLAQPRP